MTTSEHLIVISQDEVNSEKVLELKQKYPILITHSGTHHADEILACTLVRILPKYRNAAIVRTRDDKIFSLGDIVVDVGDVCDPKSFRFDHHQKTFTECWNDDQKKTKLSSAGLVWKYFGKEIIKELIKNISDDQAEEMLQHFYKIFLESIDASDNGVQGCSVPAKFSGTNTHFANFVSAGNVRWNGDMNEQSKYFSNVLLRMDDEFQKIWKFFENVWYPSKDEITKLIQQNGNSQIIKMPITNFRGLDLYIPYWVPNHKLKFALSKFSDDCWELTGVSEKWNCISAEPTFPKSLTDLGPGEIKSKIGTGDIYSISSNFVKSKSEESLLKFVDYYKLIN